MKKERSLCADFPDDNSSMNQFVSGHWSRRPCYGTLPVVPMWSHIKETEIYCGIVQRSIWNSLGRRVKENFIFELTLFDGDTSSRLVCQEHAMHIKGRYNIYLWRIIVQHLIKCILDTRGACHLQKYILVTYNVLTTRLVWFKSQTESSSHRSQNSRRPQTKPKSEIHIPRNMSGTIRER